MDIIVRGRWTDVNDRFRRHVDSKLAKFEKLDSKIIQVDVEVSEERNPRQAGQRERVELTVRSKSLKSEDTGVVRWAVEIFNQKDELVATYDLLTENVP